METEKKTSANTTDSKCPFENGECVDCGDKTEPIQILDNWYAPSDRCGDCTKKKKEEWERDVLLKEIFERCGLKTRHETMSLDNYKPTTEGQKQVLEDLKRYNDGNVFISGPVGTGKTHLIVGLVSKIAREHLCGFRFRTGVDMLYEIRSTFNYNDPGQTDRMINIFSKANILVIDDLGAEKSTEWARETFYMIIDRRYNMMKRTFVTSNLSPKELANKLNDRLVSRLMEGAIVLKIDGNDYRITGRNQ